MKRRIGFLMIGYFLMISFLLSGCAMFQTTVKDMVKNDAAAAAQTRIAAKQICSTWALNSGALKVVLAKFKTLFPCDCEADIQAIDAIAAKCVKMDANGLKTCEELTDEDMGQVVILWAYTWGTIVRSGMQTIMQTFAPGILTKILPYVTAIGL